MPAEPSTAIRTLDLAITGMTCAACAARIEKTLNRLEGVSATVNFATEKAHATLSGSVTPDALLIAVRKAGYDALECGREADDLDFLADLDAPALDAAGDDRAAA